MAGTSNIRVSELAAALGVPGSSNLTFSKIIAAAQSNGVPLAPGGRLSLRAVGASNAARLALPGGPLRFVQTSSGKSWKAPTTGTRRILSLDAGTECRFSIEPVSGQAGASTITDAVSGLRLTAGYSVGTNNPAATHLDAAGAACPCHLAAPDSNLASQRFALSGAAGATVLASSYAAAIIPRRAADIVFSGSDMSTDETMDTWRERIRDANQNFNVYTGFVVVGANYTGAARTTASGVEYAGAWFQYAFAEPVTATSYSLAMGNISTKAIKDQYPVTWRLAGSADGATWTLLDAQVNNRILVDGPLLSTRAFAIGAPGAYRFYRLIVGGNGGGTQIRIADFFLTGTVNVRSAAFTRAPA